MANYQILKANIDEKIYENAQQKITGENLNSVLNAMVATLGAEYQFAGVATIDTNPEASDAKVFYIANGKGTYTNFGGINVTEDDVVILYYDTSWHKVATGIASQAKLTELDGKVYKLIGFNESISVDDWQHATIQQSLTIQASENYRVSPPIFIARGDVMEVNTSGINPLWAIIKCSQDGTPISGLIALNGNDDTIATYTYQATEDMYVRVSVRIVLSGYSVIHKIEGEINNIEGEINNIDKKVDALNISIATIQGIVDTSAWEHKIMSVDSYSNVNIFDNQNYRLSPVLSVKKGSVIYVNTSAGSANIVLVASCDSDGSNRRGLVITDSDSSPDTNRLYRCEIMEDSYIRIGYRYLLDGYFVSILKAEDNLLFAEMKQETPKHLRVLLIGNSYTSDAWGYVPFLLKQYGITCEIYMYWRGALSLDDLVRFWETSDQYDATSPQAADGAYRYLYYIDTRYDSSWKELPRMSAKDLVALGGWDIIQIQQLGRYTVDNSHTNPYFEQVMSLIRESYSGPYTLAWEMAWFGASFLSRENKIANLSVAEIINKDHCADIVFPCATTIFNCQENPTLAAIGDSERHNLFSYDDIHLEEGLPVYAVGCSIAEALLKRYSPVASILGNTLRPTAEDITAWNIPQAQMPQSGVITSITDENCYLAQKAAVIANKYPYEINGV